MPDEFTLQVLTNLYTAKAADALIHVHVNVRMRLISAHLAFASQRGGDSALSQQTVKFLLGFAGKRFGRHARRHPFKLLAPERFDRGGVRDHAHAILERRAARYLLARLAQDFDCAEPAASDRFKPRIKADSRYCEAGLPGSLQDRSTCLDLDNRVVDVRSDHESVTIGRAGSRMRCLAVSRSCVVLIFKKSFRMTHLTAPNASRVRE